MRGKLPIIGLIVLCMSVTVVYAALWAQIGIAAYGIIKALNLQVYQDSACTVALTYIDWGMLEPGQNKIVKCFIKSISSIDAVLSLSTSVWNPPIAQSFMQLTWNREGYILQPNQVLDANLTLHVDPTITGVYGFSFNITMTAMEV